MDGKTLEMLLSRPERIAGFDRGLEGRLRGEIGGGRAALVEIAGRDSVAAAVEAARSGCYDTLIPTIVYTGTEYGSWDRVLGNASLLSREVGGRVTVTGTVVLGSPAWWNALAMRFAAVMQRLYGLEPACVACHMYLHAARVPFARAVGARAVVAGERLYHDGRRKLSQLEPALAAYGEVLARAGVPLEVPLKDVRDGRLVERILGEEWAESEGQLRCVLEGNYRDASGEVLGRAADVEAYLEEFLKPFTQRVLRSFEEVGAPDYLTLAGEAAAAATEGRSR